MRTLYRTMLRIRIFEDRVAQLVEASEIECPCHLCVGQEAVATGVCDVLAREDYVFGGHRSHGHYLAKGANLHRMMAELFGKETGCSKGRGGSMHLVAPEVGILGTVPIVAATIPIAVGTALASVLRHDGRVSVAFFGDGAVEEGTFHESLNLAAARRLPVVFVCENNFYSSHLPLLERRVSDNIVESAAAHGTKGVRIDGNDVLAVRDAAETAVVRARNGDGPTLIEARTYRWRGHVGPSYDLDVGVSRSSELEEWKKKDPIERAAEWLRTHDSPEWRFEDVRADIDREVDEAVEAARRAPYPKPDDLRSYLFAHEERAV
jgi:pyruvate dehydrogenase E1 component alpha subunit